MADDTTIRPEPTFDGPDWHSRHVPVWTEMFRPLVGQPIRALEIGSYEGRSARWLLDNVMTHESAVLICVDPFEDARREALFDANVKCDSVHKVRAKSLPLLCELHFKSGGSPCFDFIYIDGSHEAPDVLTDAVLSFELLKIGGLLCFDDFEWDPAKDGTVHAPKLAIGAFLAINLERATVLHVGVQVWIRRLK